MRTIVRKWTPEDDDRLKALAARGIDCKSSGRVKAPANRSPRTSPQTGLPFDGLYIGRLKGRELVYAGKIDHGFDKVSAKDLQARLKPLIRKEQPYSKKIAHRGVWVEPSLLAEVEIPGQVRRRQGPASCLQGHPRGFMISPGVDADGVAETEADHCGNCPIRGTLVDMRDGQVLSTSVTARSKYTKALNARGTDADIHPGAIGSYKAADAAANKTGFAICHERRDGAERWKTSSASASGSVGPSGEPSKRSNSRFITT
jgi:hypothetical protein